MLFPVTFNDENMHSFERNKISNSLHGLLHESLGLAPAIILQFPPTKHCIPPPPPISCDSEYAWAITCNLHSYACWPKPNKQNVSKPQLSHKNMVLGFHTLWNFLPPSVSFYSNELLTVSRTNVQAWKFWCLTWLFLKVAEYPWCISNFGQEEENGPTADTYQVLQSVLQCLSAFLIVNLSCFWLRLSAWLFRHNTPFCDGSWFLIWTGRTVA
jgi:hypothetical protein